MGRMWLLTGIVLLSTSLYGKTISLGDLLKMGDQNPSLLSAENELLDARNNLEGDLRLNDSSLTIKEEWEVAEDDESLDGTLTLSIPLLDQVSLSASLDSGQDVTGKVTLKPFKFSSTAVDSQVSLSNAWVEWEEEEAHFEWEILTLGLEYLYDVRVGEWNQSHVELEDQFFLASEALYRVGDLTYDDYLEAMDDLTEAEEDLLESSSDQILSGQNLWVFLGSYEDYELKMISLESLELLTDFLWEKAKSLEVVNPQSSAVTKAQNSLYQLQREDEITLNFHPDLSLSAEFDGSLDDPSDNETTITLSLSLSEDSFNSKEKELLQSELREKQSALGQALFEDQMEKESTQSTIDQNIMARNLARRDWERKETLLRETEILYNLGERTTLELTDAQLEFKKSENLLFLRNVELIESISDYLELYSGNGIDVLSVYKKVFPT